MLVFVSLLGRKRYTTYYVVLAFASVSVNFQMKATDFPVVLFIMLYKVVLAFESGDEILKSDLSNESY